MASMKSARRQSPSHLVRQCSEKLHCGFGGLLPVLYLHFPFLLYVPGLMQSIRYTQGNVLTEAQSTVPAAVNAGATSFPPFRASLHERQPAAPRQQPAVCQPFPEWQGAQMQVTRCAAFARTILASVSCKALPIQHLCSVPGLSYVMQADGRRAWWPPTSVRPSAQTAAT
jgi:hypothetical protein